jgi:hypothetical protein
VFVGNEIGSSLRNHVNGYLRMRGWDVGLRQIKAHKHKFKRVEMMKEKAYENAGVDDAEAFNALNLQIRVKHAGFGSLSRKSNRASWVPGSDSRVI